MADQKSRELIVRPTVPKADIEKFIAKLKGVSMLNVEPKIAAGKFRTIYESPDADLVVCKTSDQMKAAKQSGKTFGYFKKVLSNSDVDEIERASQAGASFVIVDATDWKIIPLENIIAKLHRSKTKVFTTAKSSREVATMFAVLELGVDGVILSTDSEDEVEKARQQLSSTKFPIKPAKILEIKDVGTGERVCVDTDCGPLEDCIAALSSKVGTLVITRGADGALAAENRSVVEIAAAAVDKVVDTTGAGDLFAAGFLSARCRGRDLRASLEAGTTCAAEIISHFGARPEKNLKELVRL